MKIRKIKFFSIILTFLLIQVNFCLPIIYDQILGIYQCDNKSLVINSQLCHNKCQENQFYSIFSLDCQYYCENGVIAREKAYCLSTYLCIDGYYYQDKQCIKQTICQSGMIYSDQKLYLCQNCSLALNSSQCQNNCKNLEYKPSQLDDCFTYCGKGQIVKSDNCEISKQCIDGFIWNYSFNKCVKEKICEEKVYDQTFNLFQCQDCYLSSELVYCEKECLSFEYFSEQRGGCFTYCQNGKIAIDQLSCGISVQCVDRFNWDDKQKICKNCDQIQIDQQFNLYQCSNCSIASSIQQCENNCSISLYFYKDKGCFKYCGSGLLLNGTSCEDSSLCISGFTWDNQDQNCQKSDSLQYSNFGIFQCTNGSLVSNLNYCYNRCLSKQYYNYAQNQCMKYCGNGKISNIASDCSYSQFCVQGFQVFDGNLQCINIKYMTVYNYEFKIYQCQNGVLVQNIKNCDKSICKNLEYQQKSINCLTYCGNGVVSQNKEGCSSSQLCIDGFYWNQIDQKCKMCNQVILDPFINLYVCQNCSLVTNIQQCGFCLINYYYSQIQRKCLRYCGNGILANTPNDCSSENFCIDGLQWNDSEKKCEKCIQKVIDSNLNILQCQNCILVSDIRLCQKSCINFQYYSQQYGCMQYCENGIIALDQTNCQQSQICIDGYLFSDLAKKCEKCKENLFDNKFQIYQCNNCGLVSNLSLCQQSLGCSNNQFYSQQLNTCMTYCGNGLIANGLKNCFSQKICIDGFQFNSITKQCQKQENCTDSIFDQSLNIYQCTNCSLVKKSQFCQNNCLNLQFYSLLIGQCLVNCGQGKIAYTLEGCQSTNLCIDGFQWKNNQCQEEVSCSQALIDQDLNLYRCLNCSLVTNLNFCKNICTNLQYYSRRQDECMVYCGDGIIQSIGQTSCSSSNLCIDGLVWNDQTNKCEKSCSEGLISDYYVKVCGNCSFATNFLSCNQSCSKYYFYDQNQRDCFYYCGSGLIALDDNSCQYTQICIDGFQWNSSSKKCESKQQNECPKSIVSDKYVKLCDNCMLVSDNKFCQSSCLKSYYYNYFNGVDKTCYLYCGNGQIATNLEECLTSRYCVDGFGWNQYSKKCEKITCDEQMFDNILKLYQCSNCSLVLNKQFCDNKCSMFQFFNFGICMAYCGNGIIAKDQDSCKTSTLYIDGTKVSEQGNTNQLSEGGKDTEQNNQSYLIALILIPSFFILILIFLILCWNKYRHQQNKIQVDQQKKIEILEDDTLNTLRSLQANQAEFERLKMKINSLQQNELNENQILPILNSQNQVQVFGEENQVQVLDEENSSRQTANMIEDYNQIQ